jgi:hypothetical protein
MPRFYLHVRIGESLFRDPEGAAFDDLESARQEAVEAARELAAECIRFDRPLDGQLEIVDEDGSKLVAVTLRSAVRMERP